MAKDGKAAGRMAVAVKDSAVKAALDAAEVRLAQLEQFIRQLHEVERRSEGDAIKAAVLQGLALNFAKYMIARGEFERWCEDRFPEISEGRKFYYRKIAANFQARAADRLGLPDYKDHTGSSALIRKFGSGSEADRLLEDYIGGRSMTEILYEIGARAPAKKGGFRPAAPEVKRFLSSVRPDLSVADYGEWDENTKRQFHEFCSAQIKPADQARLKYEAARSAFNFSLGKLADLVSGTQPSYQLLSPAECAEIAAQLRGLADAVARFAAKGRAAKPKADKAKTKKARGAAPQAGDTI